MENIIKIQNHFTIIDEGGVRSFLFEGKDKSMLIDTGFGSIPVKDIVKELTDTDVFLLNTHTDKDHTGCNKDFDKVYMHPSEMEHYKNALPEGCKIEDVMPVWEGDIIDLGYWKFEVILTPGHTPGSIMLLERDKRMLISGDTIQDGDIFMFGPGRNMEAFICSLKKILKITDSFDSIWPSHGSYNVDKEIIPKIIRGAKDLLEGKIEGQEPPWPMPCKKYVCEAAGILYDFK